MAAETRDLLLRLALSAAMVVSAGTTEGAEPGRLEPGGVHLSWVRAEGAGTCITPQSLQGAVAVRLGRDPFQGEARQWIEGVVFADGGGFTVQLFERDAAGNTVGARTLREVAGECRELDDAVALAVALIIDPTAKLGPQQDAGELEPQQEPGPSDQTAAPPPAASEIPPPAGRPCPACTRCRAAPTGVAEGRAGSPRSPGLVVSPVIVGSVFPEAAVGVEAAVRAPVLGTQSPLVWQFGTLLLPEKRVRSGPADLGYGLTTYDAGLCAVSEGSLGWMACVTLDAGVIHTVVRSPEPLQPGDRLWLAGRAHGGARLELPGPFWVELRGFGAVPITRWRFRVRIPGQPAREAHQQPWFMPGAGLGLGLHFG